MAMSLSTLSHAVEKQEWLDPAVDVAQNAISSAVELAGNVGETARDLLHGEDWLGHPLHPAMVTVPIGAWVTGVTLDGVDAVRHDTRLQAGADAAIAIGVVSALASAVAGWADWSTLDDPRTRRTGIVHAGVNIATIALFGTSWLLRKRNARQAGRIAAIAGLLTGTAGAYLGGSMAYERGAGVTDH